MDFDPLLGLDEDYLLERESRLSRSQLWQLQRAFYTDTPEGFSSGTVPLYATTNAFIAQTYAQLIHSFASSTDEPVTIIELGAGHGRFGFMCLSLLLDRYRLAGAEPPIRYVLTDFTPHSLRAWEANPKLAGLAADGWLDLSCFDAERDVALRLTHSGETIDTASPCGPLVVIANYVFDGLIQDVFRVRGGGLEEGLISLVADHPWPDATTPGLLSRLSTLFTYAPVESAIYEDPALNRILDFYRRSLPGSSFGIPLGAVRCIQRLDALSEGAMMVLSSDKAHNHLHQLQGGAAPYVATHGSVSMMVNHDAIGRYVSSRGGHTLLSAARSGELETAAFVLGQDKSAGLAQTFADTVGRFSPSDYLTLFKESAPLTVAGCLKLLQLSGWDPHWLCQLIPTLRENLSGISPVQRRELLDGLATADALVFPIGGEDRSVAIGALREAL